FALALSLAQAADADLIIGTDPDADRMGVMVRKRRDGSEGDPGDGDSYVLLNGNQIGALLLHYILTRKKRAGTLPADGAIIKSIVTGDLGARIAARFGVAVIETLTGFKYIGEKMEEFART